MFRKLVIAAAIALSLPNPILAQTAQEAPAAQTTDFDQRAAQLVDLLAGRFPYAEFFDSTFQTAVPEEQFVSINASLIAQYGQPVAMEAATPANGRAGTVRLRFEKGVATILLEVGGAADRRVSGLRLTGFDMANDSFDKVAGELAALPGKAGFLVAEIEGTTIKPLASARASELFAIGSTFKLYILDELAARIAAGERKWSDVVPLSHLSFSSLGTANWPKDTPVTVSSLAIWMISVSDNSATDTLIHLLGRERIEARMRAAAHSDPSRNIPFLTTVEAFALKGGNFKTQRDVFLKGDDEAQRKLIATNSDKLLLANVDVVSISGGPRFIESLEWFASPTDVAHAMIDLKSHGSDTAMEVMAINPGVNRSATEAWRYLGYKGGSEIGVISMSLLGERKLDGKWFVVTASWNNSDAAVSTETMVGLITRLLALAAK